MFFFLVCEVEMLTNLNAFTMFFCPVVRVRLCEFFFVSCPKILNKVKWEKFNPLIQKISYKLIEYLRKYHVEKKNFIHAFQVQI